MSTLTGLTGPPGGPLPGLGLCDGYAVTPGAPHWESTRPAGSLDQPHPDATLGHLRAQALATGSTWAGEGLRQPFRLQEAQAWGGWRRKKELGLASLLKVAQGLKGRERVELSLGTGPHA